MDISRAEQRVLHLLAQGGQIMLIRNDAGTPEEVPRYTREGCRYTGLDLAPFRKLKWRGTIASSGGKPYRITRCRLQLVRSQPDNC